MLRSRTRIQLPPFLSNAPSFRSVIPSSPERIRIPRIRCTSQRRLLHLAPPFLLEDYAPRYMTLSSVDAAKKRSAAYAHLRNCNLCPRLCGVNRYETTGMCLIGDKAKVNVIAPHFGEGTYRISLSWVQVLSRVLVADGKLSCLVV